MPRLRLLVIAVTMAGCGEGWEAIDVHTLPVAADEPDAAAVVLLDEHDLRFAAGDALGKPIVDETRHVRVRILREGGESVALVRVPYQPDFAEVIALAARTVAADGSTRQFGRRDAVDVPDHGDYVLYSDLRALILALAPARPGTVVEYRYTVRHYDQGGLRFAHTFGGGHPVRRSR